MTDSLSPEDGARLRALADSLDCLTDADLQLLSGTTASTTENWRKRGQGPAYVLVGNRYLYPRAAVVAFLTANTRERAGRVPAKDLL